MIPAFSRSIGLYIILPGKFVNFFKNWNSYILRYGSCIAYYEYWHSQPQGIQHLEARLYQMTRGSWRQERSRFRTQHHEQLDRFRFQHHRQAFLAGLEAQWSAAC